MNFNAGPATLPLAALERARDEMIDWQNTGMSVMEHSHRGKEYEALHAEAQSLLRELAGIGDDSDVLFLQGGASQQFAEVPMNFLGEGKSADYLVNGVWGEKAIAEAEVVAKLMGGSVRTLASPEPDKHYTHAVDPSTLSLDAKAAYVHFTSNETIHGIQYATTPGATFPDFGKAPLVCDMSSDFLWRKMDLSRFSFVYAGAQKNLGPSGVIIVVAKKEFLARGRKDIPKIFQYREHAAAHSLLNTPPTFAIYLVRNVLDGIKKNGGLDAMEAKNRAKASLLYAAIDEDAAFYACPIAQANRSLMNVVFRLPTPALDDKFVSEAKARRMIGLKGHRSVGGIRVSLYNAVEIEWVCALTDFMREFAKTNA
jgi:phosphoserine aminotransferase